MFPTCQKTKSILQCYENKGNKNNNLTLTSNGKLEQIAMSSSANKIELDMQEHKLVKNYLLSFRPFMCKVIRKMFIFFTSMKQTKDQSLHH